MARGISIHIGLNRVDPDRYGGWDGQLAGCVNDARAMRSIANSLGFHSTLLLDDQATSLQVTQALGMAAQQLVAGDILLLTYSGHGGQVPDANGDEEDGKDETWVLYDRMVVDDQLYQLWTQFQPGVRIFFLSDSCHSGTVAKDVVYPQLWSAGTELAKQYRGTRRRAGRKNVPPHFRLIPDEARDRAYSQEQELYSMVQWASAKGDGATVGASLILISGCQDNQVSADGDENGLFTGTLLDVWDDGAFAGNYYSFWKEILHRMPPTQSPRYFKVGADDPEFENQRPFTIDGTSSWPTEAHAPSIQGPILLSSSAGPPEFTVDPGKNRFYAVEVSNEANLFDYRSHGDERDDDNFFASWHETPLLSSSSYPVVYRLPDGPWHRLKKRANRLYYRLWATDDSMDWVNRATTTPDAQAYDAPCISIERRNHRSRGTRAAGPSISGPSQSSLSGGPPQFDVDPGENDFYAVEVATESEYFDSENHGDERNDSNFYASYESAPLFSSNPYVLPDDVWERLAGDADRLYYRVFTSASAEAWENVETSTSDEEADEAPFIKVLSGTDSNDDLPVLLGYLGFTPDYFESQEERYFEALGALLKYHDIIDEGEVVDRENFRDAVRAFQDRASLSTDGIPGEDTLWALQEEWAQNRDLEIQKVEADVWERPGHSGYDPAQDGYDNFMLREDAVPYYEALRKAVSDAGGVVTSAGAFRKLSAQVTAGRSPTSIHYSGLAFDLALPTGMTDPEEDPYIVTREDNRWRIWARAEGGDEQTLQAIIFQGGDTSTQPVTAKVIDFTAFADYFGFESIGPRSCFPAQYVCAEWWHFQGDGALVPGISQFGIELLSLEMYSEGDLSAASDVWANKKRIFKRTQNGWY